MMRKMFTIFIALMIMFTFELKAKCEKSAIVKYEQQYGWSKKYTVNVNFMSGFELNTATSSYKYSSTSLYAVIFWGENQASIIKLNYIIYSLEEVDCKDIENSIFDFQGYDQENTKWNICLSNLCF